MRRIAALALVTAIVTVATAPGAIAQAPDEQAETERMWAIAEGLFCPVCQGQSVRESNAALAQQMRELILARIEAGDSDEAIYDFFVARYGPEVLRDPPKSGISLATWITPIAVLAVGLLVVLRALARRRRTAPTADRSNLETYERLVDELRERETADGDSA